MDRRRFLGALFALPAVAALGKGSERPVRVFQGGDFVAGEVLFRVPIMVSPESTANRLRYDRSCAWPEGTFEADSTTAECAEAFARTLERMDELGLG